MTAPAGASFNADYYLAVATIMPIVIVALVIETRALGGRDVQHVLSGVRLISKNWFTALINPFNWIIVVPFVLGPVASFVAEGFSLAGLHERHVSGLNDVIITISIVLAFVSVFFNGMLLVFRDAEDEEPSTEPTATSES